MDLESGVYGLSAGAIIVLMAYTLGYRLTFQQRMQRMGYWFIATFLFNRLAAWWRWRGIRAAQWDRIGPAAHLHGGPEGHGPTAALIFP